MDINLNPPSHFNKQKIDLLSPDSFNKPKIKPNDFKQKPNSNNCDLLFERIETDKSEKLFHLSKEINQMKDLNENLQKQIFNLIKSYQENLNSLNKEYEKNTNELEDNLAKLSQNLLETTEMNNKKDLEIKHKDGKIFELESDLKILTNKYEYECNEHTLKISKFEKDYILLKDNLDQTKRYLYNAENELNMFSDTKLTIQILEDQIKTLSDANNSINNEMKLLKLKLKSIFEVIAVQEKLISSVSFESKQAALLTRWRQKVFELLVQLKSQDFEFKNEKQQWNQQEKLFIQDVETLNLKVAYLEACLNQQKIETTIHQEKIQSLNDEIANLRRQLGVKENMNGDFNFNLKNMARLLERILKLKFFDDIFAKVNLTNNRLKFASQRMNLLHAQFAHRDAYTISNYEKRKKYRLRLCVDTTVCVHG